MLARTRALKSRRNSTARTNSGLDPSDKCCTQLCDKTAQLTGSRTGDIVFPSGIAAF